MYIQATKMSPDAGHFFRASLTVGLELSKKVIGRVNLMLRTASRKAMAVVAKEQFPSQHELGNILDLYSVCIGRCFLLTGGGGIQSKTRGLYSLAPPCCLTLCNNFRKGNTSVSRIIQSPYY